MPAVASRPAIMASAATATRETPLLTVAPALKAAAARLREACDDVPVTRADIAVAARAERARDMAIGAAGRKHAARERGDTASAREALGQEQAQLASARDLDAKLAADRHERRDARWASRTLNETIALEMARGEVVERRKSGGARIVTRDGLDTMANPDNGTAGLTSIQHRAGLLYRDVHEGAREDLGSQLGAIQGGGAVGSTTFNPDKETRSQRKSRLCRQKAEIHDKVRRATHDLACVQLLEAVAGDGRNISRLRPGSGSGQAKASKQLRAALDVVASHFGLR